MKILMVLTSHDPFDWQRYALVAQRLVTGQNPASLALALADS